MHDWFDYRMFYFFFESRTNTTDPVVIWLSGGPGCSSSVALFYENGPFKISDDLSLSWNDFGWDKVCWLVLCLFRREETCFLLHKKHIHLQHS